MKTPINQLFLNKLHISQCPPVWMSSFRSVLVNLRTFFRILRKNQQTSEILKQHLATLFIVSWSQAGPQDDMQDVTSVFLIALRNCSVLAGVYCRDVTLREGGGRGRQRGARLSRQVTRVLRQDRGLALWFPKVMAGWASEIASGRRQ